MMQLPNNDNVLENEETKDLVIGTASSTSILPTPTRSSIGSKTSRKKTKGGISCDVRIMTRLIGVSSVLIVLLLMAYSITLGSDGAETHLESVEEKPITAILPYYESSVEETPNKPDEDSTEPSIEDSTEIPEPGIEEATKEEPSETQTDIEEEEINEGINEESNETPTDIEEKEIDEESNDTPTDIGEEEAKEDTIDESGEVSKESAKEDEYEFHTNEDLIPEWGKWGFWDGAEEIRPTEDYCGDYPNCDIPDDKFPENAWQEDAVFVNHFLDAASDLVSRAQEAIYTEYGHSKEGLTPEEKLERSKMFHLEIIDFEQGEKPEKEYSGGGWTTKDSMKGLSRRLLHAMVTRDTFTVVMGGHSSAAGHGNFFKQSYMMVFHQFMEPIFKRLGVTLITRNLAHGGLGTLQSGLGSGSIYGDEIDMLLWESGMTEKENRALDLFYRQALLAGKRPPVLFGGSSYVLEKLHEEVGAHVGAIGSGYLGIPLTTNEVQVKELPWSSQFLVCDGQEQALCDDVENKFRTTCWIDRPDVNPPNKQNSMISGTAKWHPGWRTHQLKGRKLSFIVLTAISAAVNEWSENTIFEGFPLSSEFWHVTDDYNEIKSKVRELHRDPSESLCEEYASLGELPERVCSIPLKSRSEFTPRANVENNSITEIVKAAPDGYLPEQQKKVLYDGPNVPIPELEVPDGAIDVRAIVSNRRLQVKEAPSSSLKMQPSTISSISKKDSLRKRRLDEEIKPGSGWYLDAKPGFCDGTYDALCGREIDSSCLLDDHMDYRGGLLGDGLSGWLVMDIQGLKEGLIMLKLETWHSPGENPVTDGWTEINNGSRKRRTLEANASSEERHLKTELPEYCNEFQFQYAIDGKITTLNKDQFLDKITNPQRVVEILTILDDEEMAKEEKERDVEVAIRLTGCAREKVFKLTHIYWA